MNKNTILLFVAILVLSIGTGLQAQEIKFGDLDKSSMDAAHYPRRAAFQNYLAEDDADRTQYVKVFYGRPMKKDRAIFGSLVPWGQDWRLGANEATEVSFYRAVEIGGTTIPAGHYTMFAQVYPNQWIIKISSERFIGGSQDRDITKDLVAVAIPTRTVSDVRETFTIGFRKVDDGHANMVFAWDQTEAELPINFNAASLAGDDASPMDLVQYPNMSRLRNYVEEADLEANEPQVRVVYSRPQMKGRKIFGELLEFGEMWRVGANETTELTFFEEVVIGGETIRPGRYGLFAVVNDGSWEFVIHDNVQSWGSTNHNEEDNIVKVVAKTEKTPTTLEALSMTFAEKGDNQIELVIGWANTMARLPITVNKK